MTPSPAADAAELARELRIHQAELETQNEELRRAQLELAAARDRYRHLFEVAPVGYLSLDEIGRIAELNVTGATLLGKAREELLGRPFDACLHRRERRRWRGHLASLVPGGAAGRLEATLANEEAAPRTVQLDTLRLAAPGPEGAMRVTLTDISARRAAETDRRIAAQLIEARDAERLRVARTLHEDLGQRLSAIKIGVSLLSPGVAAGTDAAGEPTQALQRELDATITLVRRMANELHPAMLDDFGLNAAMQWLAREAGRRLGLRVALLEAPRDPPLAPRTVIGVYRLLEGLLEEVARDTRDAQVVIALREQGGALRVDMTVQPGGWPLAPGPHPSDARARPARGGRAAGRLAVRPALKAELLLLGGRFLEGPAVADVDPGACGLQVLIPLSPPRSRARSAERTP